MKAHLPKDDELRFFPQEHRYFLGQRELPSVTRIIGSVFALDIPEEILRPAQERGTMVHRITELDDQDDLDESTVAPEFQPYLEAWRAFRKASGFVPDPDGIEIRTYHPSFYYAGTIDRIGRLGNGRRIVIDIKTGGKYPHYRIQLAAYCNLLADPLNYLRGSVTLDRDGSFWFDEFSREDFPMDLAVFRSCLNVYTFKTKYKLL